VNRTHHRARAGLGIVAASACLAVALAACLPSAIRSTPVLPPATAEPTAPPVPTPTPGPPTPTPGPTFRAYKVVAGDTMSRIARRFHTSTLSLSYWNRKRYPTLDPENAHYNADRVERGWVLQLIPNHEYVAPPDDGETGIQVTPTPDDNIDATDPPSAGPSDGASPSPS
jgi:hypothetical protein